MGALQWVMPELESPKGCLLIIGFVVGVSFLGYLWGVRMGPSTVTDTPGGEWTQVVNDRPTGLLGTLPKLWQVELEGGTDCYLVQGTWGNALECVKDTETCREETP